MTEQKIRQTVVDKARTFMGAKKGGTVHRAIVDTYNAYPDRPLRNGRPYNVTYTDNWCATFVSAVGIALDLTEIMPVECSCTAMIALYKAKGRWVEDDAYVPKIGDIIMYYWGDGKDYATTDQRNAPNHVGFVTKVRGNTMTITEGNMGSSSVVGDRTIQINGRYIRGYCCPDYASMADNTEEDNMKLYKYVNELPYGQEAVTKAIQNCYINLAEDGSMGLWEPNIQTIILMNRAGLFDKPAIEGR